MTSQQMPAEPTGQQVVTAKICPAGLWIQLKPQRQPGLQPTGEGIVSRGPSR